MIHVIKNAEGFRLRDPKGTEWGGFTLRRFPPPGSIVGRKKFSLRLFDANLEIVGKSYWKISDLESWMNFLSPKAGRYFCPKLRDYILVLIFAWVRADEEFERSPSKSRWWAKRTCFLLGESNSEERVAATSLHRRREATPTPIDEL